MTTNRRSAGGPGRRPLEPRSWARPPGLGLLALAMLGLIQAGCQSSGCFGCGGLSGLGSRVTNGVQALGARVSNTGSRIFNHKGGAGCSTCGDGGVFEGGTVVEPGIPIAPGGMVVPAPGTVVTPSGPIESAPTELSPIDDNPTGSKPANPTGTKGAANPGANRGLPVNTRSAYEANLPRNKNFRGRTTDVARAIHSTGSSAESSDLLDHIPPVDVPAEVTQKAVSLPGSISAPSPAAVPAPSQAPPSPAVASPPAPPAGEAVKPITPPPAETVSAAEGLTKSAPGIRRTASVAPSVGGGSAPSIEGLRWLKEKGYRTFLDLRSMSEIDPNFVESVNDHGMVYLSLPILADHLDSTRLARFDDLISRSENRPLYFCDTDGTRAGLVWYIHLRTVEGNDPQAATQRAEEIGLTSTQANLAEGFLASHKTRAKAAVAPTPAAVLAASEAPKQDGPRSSPALPAASTSPAVPPAPVKPPAPSNASTPPMLPGEDRPQASKKPETERYPAPIAWRPIAALVLTGVGVPLAYWSKSALSGVRFNRRNLASLPGSARRSLDPPAGSDA